MSAFLLLAIVPLSLLAFLTYNQIQRDAGQQRTASLESMVALQEAHLTDWIEGHERQLALLVHVLEDGTDPALDALVLLDEGGDKEAITPLVNPHLLAEIRPALEAGRRLVVVPSEGQGDPWLAVGHDWQGRWLVGLVPWTSLEEIVATSAGAELGVTTRLATEEILITSAAGWRRLAGAQAGQAEGILAALDGQGGAGAYTDLDGVPVFGAYRWLPDLQVALAVVQPQTEALAAGNTVMALVIGATLAVALITAAIAAVATRRITQPLVQLTQTAAWMARGDLNQQVPVTRRDEIGVLARAFNRMAAELRDLYSGLEAKVAERTRQLQEAHERTRYYVMQLALSAEVARVATSIRDLEVLLASVVQLIGDAFELSYVSAFLLDDSGQTALWQAGSRQRSPEPEHQVVGGPGLVGQVAADGQRRVSATRQGCELALPLRTGRGLLGVLHLQSKRPNDFDENDEMVYQSLADQISIAIENARAYALERETVQRLRELDQIQSQFLTNMSHALRTPLNSVIGFSRVMLKELDGPLTDLQRTDLSTIYDSGRQLLGLINDMLELTQLDLGTAPFALSRVDLAEIIEGVMATARALAMSKPLHLVEQVPDDLPILYTDGQRVRQVILALLSNAVKYTETGTIRLEARQDDGHVIVSVQDTGIGIPPEERAHILADPESDEIGSESPTPGFGLALSRRVVERLGGEIWLESREGSGSTFTFTLPIEPAS